jgi:tetratricopeptide (TPR) repeat protein
MISPEESYNSIHHPLGRSYYRLGLAAAKQRDLSAALAYASLARILDPEHEGAARLAEICRYELGETDEIREPALERIVLLAGQGKWRAAATAAKRGPQSVRTLNIQGCLWALAKRYGPAADCFSKALARDRGNALAAEALACLGRRRRYWGGFFVPL